MLMLPDISIVGVLVGLTVGLIVIVEVGVVMLDIGNGCIETVFHQLVKEKGFCQDHKDSWVFKNSDLKYEDVLNAKPLDLGKLQGVLALYHAAAWNSSFDFSFLISRGLIISMLPCPMKMSVSYFQIKSKYGDWKWPSVQEAWNHLFPKSKYVEKHRGLDDAIHEAKIMHTLYHKDAWKIDNILFNKDE